MRKAVLCCLLAAALMAGLPAEASIWDNIATTFTNAWVSTKNVFNNAANTVECKAVDLTTFSMDPCWDAPASDLCTDACKAQLDKLPETCMERLASEVVAEGNTNITARLEQQFDACGYTNLTAWTSAAWSCGASLLGPLAAAGLGAALVGLLG